MVNSFKLAQLDDACKQKLRVFEKDWGVVLVAYEAEKGLVRLSQQQLNKLQKLEEELGVVLVAHNEPARSTNDQDAVPDRYEGG